MIKNRTGEMLQENLITKLCETYLKNRYYVNSKEVRFNNDTNSQ